MNKLFLALLLLLAPLLGVASGSEIDTRHYIYIEASASVQAKADMASVTLSFSDKAMTSDAVMTEINSKLAKLLDAVKQIGVAPADIETTDFKFDRVYIIAKDQDGKPIDSYPDPNRDQFDGFRATNTVSIMIRDTKIIGRVLGAAAALGAEVGTPSFSSSREDDYTTQAKQRAVEAALQKGKLYATGLGTSLGNVLAVKEGAGYNPDTMEYPADGDGEADLGVTTSPGTEIATIAEQVPILPPILTFSASVSVKWEVADGAK